MAQAQGELEPPKRRGGRPKGSKNKPKGAIQPDHIEKIVVQGFALAAMARNAEHWHCKHPEIEVRPWADDAAELLNKLPEHYLESATTLSSSLAVAFGLGMMVYVRLNMDHQLRMVGARNNVTELRRQEGISHEPDNESHPRTRTTENNQTEPHPGHMNEALHKPGTGASPVHPREAVPGLSKTGEWM